MKTIMLSDETIQRGITMLRSTMSDEDAVYDGLIHTLIVALFSRGEIAIEQEWCQTHGWVTTSHVCASHVSGCPDRYRNGG